MIKVGAVELSVVEAMKRITLLQNHIKNTRLILDKLEANTISKASTRKSLIDSSLKTGLYTAKGAGASATTTMQRGKFAETGVAGRALAEAKGVVLNANMMKTSLANTKQHLVKLELVKKTAAAKTLGDIKKNNKNNLALQKVANEQSEEEAKATSKRIGQHFATGFSMHILQIYAAPAIRAVNRAIKQTLTTFAEFDKVYTDFAVKSEEFGRIMSRSEIYSLAAGQAFSATNLAQAGERFAASGIDVAKSSDAMIKSLELATIANIGFDESANVVIKTMQAYHLPMSEASRITDTMVNVANASTAELKDLSEWFGYAANSAYLAGVDIEEFATILGVLSSTGMKNVGPATRQIFAQFQKERVREGFRGKFGLASDESFSDMNAVIQQLRQYVQSSEDIKKVSRDVAVTIGGKVAAQTALTNLLTAEASLWESVSSASMKAGSTTELYTKITDNAWHSLERIKNSLQLIMIQFGESFAPILKHVSNAFEIVTKILIAIPDSIKSIFGAAIMAITGGLGAIMMVMLGYVGFISIAAGATEMLATSHGRAAEMEGRGTVILAKLSHEMLRYVNVATAASTVTERNTLSNTKVAASVNVAAGAEAKRTAILTRANIAAVANNKTVRTTSSIMGAMSGAMIGWMATSHFASKQMFAEARAANVLTSAWIGLSIAKTGSLPAILAGAAIGGTAFIAGESQINRAQMEYDMSRRAGVSNSFTYQYNINGVQITDAKNAEDLLNKISTFTGSGGTTFNVTGE